MAFERMEKIRIAASFETTQLSGNILELFETRKKMAILILKSSNSLSNKDIYLQFDIMNETIKKYLGL